MQGRSSQPPPYAAGSSLQYAGGGFPPAGPLPVGAAVTSLVLGILALLLSFFAICLWIAMRQIERRLIK